MHVPQAGVGASQQTTFRKQARRNREYIRRYMIAHAGQNPQQQQVLRPQLVHALQQMPGNYYLI